jgi:hypothetical protein
LIYRRLCDRTAELGRVQKAINVVIQAARVYANNRNPEHANLLISSTLRIATSPALPMRDGQEAVVQESAEAAVDETDDFDRGNFG